MIKVHRYLPGWTAPCISPYVTKVVNTKDHTAGKSNLTDYLNRMKARFDV